MVIEGDARATWIAVAATANKDWGTIEAPSEARSAGVPRGGVWGGAL